MENCKQHCNDIQQKINTKRDEINEIKDIHKTVRYSEDELQQYNKLDTEFDNLNLDLQRCNDDCKLRNRHRDNTDEVSPVDPEILKQLEDLEGGRTRSTIRRRNKSKTKRRQTRSTRRRKTRHRSTRSTRKQ